MAVLRRPAAGPLMCNDYGNLVPYRIFMNSPERNLRRTNGALRKWTRIGFALPASGGP